MRLTSPVRAVAVVLRDVGRDVYLAGDERTPGTPVARIVN
jgi:hypothetical protein